MMSEQFTPDERLLLPILRAADQAAETESPAAHPDDELLALFAQGALDGDQREELVHHLDACVTCRRTTSLLLSDDLLAPSHEVPAPVQVEPRHHFWQVPNRAAAYALAASLLVAVGLYFRFQWLDPRIAERRAYDEASEMLAANQFAKAREFLAVAEEHGTTSDRLRSLHSQAVRQLPGPVALAFAGRLGDFGYEPGGVVAREAADRKLGQGLKPAYELLRDTGTDEVETVLNRGHALLVLRRPQDALTEFQRAAELAPNEPLVWLGYGLAEFMLDDFVVAEHDFRESLRLDGKNIAASMNLGLTLEELGRRDEALAVWRGLLVASLPEADRTLAQRAVHELEGP